MKATIWLIMIIMFFYTIGFAITLWKAKSIRGSIATFILAIAIVVIPLIFHIP